VNHPDRGLRGLRALSDTLAAVSARMVGQQPIVRGATFEHEVAALVRGIVEEAALADAPPAHGMGASLRPRALVAAWVDAFNRADVDALAAFYAEAAVNDQVAQDPVEGRAAIRAM